MNHPNRVCVLTILLTFACGGSSPCTIVLTGSAGKYAPFFSGTYACQPGAALWRSADNAGQFGISSSLGSTDSSATIGMYYSGELTAGHFTAANAPGFGVYIDSSINNGFSLGTYEWDANSTLGSFDLTITSVASSPAPYGKDYVIHGVVEATAVPNNFQDGSVEVHATF
ncbi:MAG TPA: hypothetical protein VLW85_24945 [Myxococcales bacterium]|nr:hypothetical protein [Myxococcales bacterium]